MFVTSSGQSWNCTYGVHMFPLWLYRNTQVMFANYCNQIKACSPNNCWTCVCAMQCKQVPPLYVHIKRHISPARNVDTFHQPHAGSHSNTKNRLHESSMKGFISLSISRLIMPLRHNFFWEHAKVWPAKLLFNKDAENVITSLVLLNKSAGSKGLPAALSRHMLKNNRSVLM